jgi:hypothetical protein
MANFHDCLKSGKKGTAANHAAYISRKGSYGGREDLIATGCGNMPSWADDDPICFWRAGDKHERQNGAVYREHEIALPTELTHDQQLDLIGKLIQGIANGKPYQWALHSPNSSLGEQKNPHLHLMYSDRIDDGIDRPPEQLFRRFNPEHPEQGGRKKDSGGKNRMILRDELIETRCKIAEQINVALEEHGHEARVDHRTLKARGVEREPERYLGPARLRHMTADEKTQVAAARKGNRA